VGNGIRGENGVVAFAGPFRGCGLLLIAEHRDRYYSLLAGLERINAGTGQHVRPGDSRGAMEHRNPGNLSLYMELRKNMPTFCRGLRRANER
jgi:septal ring factor EnvC (AmiA/AmiB activator)